MIAEIPFVRQPEFRAREKVRVCNAHSPYSGQSGTVIATSTNAEREMVSVYIEQPIGVVWFYAHEICKI